jgi:hypothetical protein
MATISWRDGRDDLLHISWRNLEMSVRFYINHNSLPYTCREGVLNRLRHSGSYNEGVKIQFVRTLDPRSIEDRVDQVLGIIDWRIEPRTGSSHLWVESPRDKLPHLHAVLGILRGEVPGYRSPKFEELALKTILKMGINTARSTGYNGICSFVVNRVPAGEFYKTFQEFVPEVRSGDELLCDEGYLLIFALTPEELNDIGNYWAACTACGKYLASIVTPHIDTLAAKIHRQVECACGTHLCRRPAFVDIPISRIRDDSKSFSRQTSSSRQLLVLDMIVNNKGGTD